MKEITSSRIPIPKGASLDAESTCILVLDLTPRADFETVDGKAFVQRLSGFLDRARIVEVPTLFTASLSEVGKDVLAGLGRRDVEPVFRPDAFDKMRSEEIQQFVGDNGCENLVVTGFAANHAIMNTVIGTARHFHSLGVYVPLDGVHSADDYTFEYAMYQMNHLPGSARPPLFTTLDLIDFVAGGVTGS